MVLYFFGEKKHKKGAIPRPPVLTIDGGGVSIYLQKRFHEKMPVFSWIDRKRDHLIADKESKSLSDYFWKQRRMMGDPHIARMLSGSTGRDSTTFFGFITSG